MENERVHLEDIEAQIILVNSESQLKWYSDTLAELIGGLEDASFEDLES